MDFALSLNPDYDDAMIYKNLLIREKVRFTTDPAEQAKLTAMADDWFNKALETRKRNAQRRAPQGVPTGQEPPRAIVDETFQRFPTQLPWHPSGRCRTSKDGEF